MKLSYLQWILSSILSNHALQTCLEVFFEKNCCTYCLNIITVIVFRNLVGYSKLNIFLIKTSILFQSLRFTYCSRWNCVIFIPNYFHSGCRVFHLIIVLFSSLYKNEPWKNLPSLKEYIMRLVYIMKIVLFYC